MKQLLIVFIFALPLSVYASTSKICYFSLNNEKEFEEMQKFTARINQHSKEKIEVVEFMGEGSDVDRSFLKMVQSGVKCDGLVISGHHTGSFGGARGSGTLDVDFMERLSCDKRFKDFFHGIKALWLQGCRTLGVDKIETLDSADYHMERVYNVREQDHLSQNPLELNVEFSQTLDQDNPLSSRYLRIFPRATTFGWTKTAPGEESLSERSIPFHIAQLARLNDDRGVYFDDPTSEFSELSATKYAEAILSLLNRPAEDARCGNFEDVAVEAWMAHGNWDKTRRFAFDNPDINAYKSLVTGDYGPLWEAKSLECILKGTNKNSEILDAIKRASSDPFLVGYTYNSLFEVLKRASREGNIELYDNVKKELMQSPYFTNFMMEKLASKELGIVRKIEYYAFYKELVGEENKGIEKKINDSFISFMNKPINSGNGVDYELRDAQMTLAQAMIKNKLATPESIAKVVKNTKNDNVLLSIVTSLEAYPVSGSAPIFYELVKVPSSAVLRGAGLAIGSAKISLSERTALISEMTRIHGDRGIPSAVAALKVSRCGVRNCKETLAAMIGKSRDRGLDSIANLLGEIEVDSADTLIQEISTKLSSSRYKGRFASSVGRAKGVSADQKLEIFEDLLKDKKVPRSKIAEGLGAVRGIGDDQLALFDRLIEDPDSRVHLVNTLAHSKISDGKYKERFRALVNSSKGDDSLVEILSKELVYTSKFDSKERKTMWNSLIAESKIGDISYWNIGEEILKLKTITDEEVSVLRQINSSLSQKYFSESFSELVEQSSSLSSDQIKLILDK